MTTNRVIDPAQALLLPLLFAALAVVASVGPLSAAQEPLAKEEMRAIWKRAMTPGPQHELLASRAGTWQLETRLWFEPGQPPVTSHGTSRMSMILGGRFLEEEVTSQTLEGEFHGLGLTGFDNVTGQFVSSWVDTMTTTIMTMTGSRDASGRTLTMTGSFIDPVTGLHKTMRIATRTVSADKHVTDFFELGPDAQERKVMQLTYTRR